jgi:hypothetical protein
VGRQKPQPTSHIHFYSFISAIHRLPSEYRIRCASKVNGSTVLWFVVRKCRTSE